MIQPLYKREKEKCNFARRYFQIIFPETIDFFPHFKKDLDKDSKKVKDPHGGQNFLIRFMEEVRGRP